VWEGWLRAARTNFVLANTFKLVSRECETASMLGCAASLLLEEEFTLLLYLYTARREHARRLTLGRLIERSCPDLKGHKCLLNSTSSETAIKDIDEAF
jgi:hypothetical protein